MRSVMFCNNAASIASFTWTLDADAILHHAIATFSNLIITSDPSLTVALWQTPTELINYPKDILVIQVGTSVTPDFKIPLQKGSRLFVQFSAAKGSVVIYIEDVLS